MANKVDHLSLSDTMGSHLAWNERIYCGSNERAEGAAATPSGYSTMHGCARLLGRVVTGALCILRSSNLIVDVCLIQCRLHLTKHNSVLVVNALEHIHGLL